MCCWGKRSKLSIEQRLREINFYVVSYVGSFIQQWILFDKIRLSVVNVYCITWMLKSIMAGVVCRFYRLHSKGYITKCTISTLRACPHYVQIPHYVLVIFYAIICIQDSMFVTYFSLLNNLLLLGLLILASNEAK